MVQSNKRHRYSKKQQDKCARPSQLHKRKFREKYKKQIKFESNGKWRNRRWENIGEEKWWRIWYIGNTNKFEFINGVEKCNNDEEKTHKPNWRQKYFWTKSMWWNARIRHYQKGVSTNSTSKYSKSIVTAKAGSSEKDKSGTDQVKKRRAAESTCI